MSAQRAKGTRFERQVADYLAATLGDDRIDRMPHHGPNDRGDVAGIRTLLGERVTVECKNVARLDLAGWLTEAEREAGNNDSNIPVVVHKRRGRGNPTDQFVTLTLAAFARLLGGEP